MCLCVCVCVCTGTDSLWLQVVEADESSVIDDMEKELLEISAEMWKAAQVCVCMYVHTHTHMYTYGAKGSGVEGRAGTEQGDGSGAGASWARGESKHAGSIEQECWN